MPEAKNQCATSFGGLYEFYIERPRLSRAIGRCLWGVDVAGMYASMEIIGRQADGSTIVDVPCGGGLALRALVPAQDVRYVAIDIDPAMLARTRSKATARGLRAVETVEADMRRLPLPDAGVDLLCTYSGLHMINDPETAISEFARVLKPGGQLVGSSFVATGSRRTRLLFAAGARRGLAVPPADGATIVRWLEAAGLTAIEIDGRGFVVFRARRT
jgi:SAM-dependent methyltransferase